MGSCLLAPIAVPETSPALVWQPRVRGAAVVDTVLVGENAAEPVTPPDGWPYKRITIAGRGHDVPDVLVR